jgi:hypothetical protein
MNLIIFSKDRPAQLELLLRSFKRFWADWDKQKIKILFKVTGEDYFAGYKRVVRVHPEFTYWNEDSIGGSFKDALLMGIEDTEEMTAFEVDDDVMIRPFDLTMPQVKRFQRDKSIMCVNLRMDREYNYCADRDEWMTVPKFENDTWEWKYSRLDWGYPMSVVFNIFRTKEIKPLVERLKFKGLELETKMSENPLPNPKMICFPKAKTVLVQINRVQDVAVNKALNIDPKEMNKRFLNGEIIRLEQFLDLDLNSCFYYPEELEWEKSK